MKKLLLHIIIIGCLLSCNQEKQLVGHWHEYRNQKHDFENCYIITDSTISTNNTTYGGTYSLDSLKIEKVWKYSRHYDGSIPSYKRINDSINFENGIVWIKQTENKETYLEDFSAGYKINIRPFESTGELIEPIMFQKGRRSIILPLGKLKPQYENREKGILSGNYYFQVNDKLTSDSYDLILFLVHSQLDKIDLYVNMDKDTPSKQKRKLDSIITFLNLKPDQIFFQHVDLKKMKSGYKNTTANNGYAL